MLRHLITTVISVAMLLTLSALNRDSINTYQHLSTLFASEAFGQDSADDGSESSSASGEATPMESEEAELEDILPSLEGERIFHEDFLPADMPEPIIETFSPWRATAGALFVLGLLFVFVWALKKYTKSGAVFTAVRKLKTLESMPVGAGKQIVLVKAGSRVLVLGVSQAGINLLDKFPASEFDKSGEDSGMEEGTGLEEQDSAGLFEEKLSEMRRRFKEDEDDA